MACASFKTAFTNYIRGHTNMFKVKYWRKNRQKKVMEIETQYIYDGIICKNIIGKIPMKACKNNKWIDYTLETKSAVKLHYDTKTNQYSLFVPTKFTVPPRDDKLRSPCTSGDPGIRTFITCIGDDRVMKIGNNIQDQIVYFLKQIDKINADDKLTNDEKTKRVANKEKRITNLVDELHWKTINRLTSMYETIYIGVLNMQSIVSNETSNISKMTKRVGLKLRHFEFRQRLEYKCNARRINYVEVNERFTSKTCSNCGAYKADLGAAKKYNCEGCGKVIDRDVNGARCILFINTKLNDV